MTDSKENKALESAKLIAMDKVERLLLEEEAEKPVVYDNKPGSFERLTGQFFS